MGVTKACYLFPKSCHSDEEYRYLNNYNVTGSKEGQDAMGT